MIINYTLQGNLLLNSVCFYLVIQTLQFIQLFFNNCLIIPPNVLIQFNYRRNSVIYI